MEFKEAQTKAVSMFSSPQFIDRIRDEDPSMVKHLDLLKSMNRLGYITTSSQAGKKNVEISERAYITGFMLEPDAVQFIKNMSLFTDKNAVFVPCCTDDTYVPASLDILLTIATRGSKTTTHMSTTLPMSYWHQEREEANLNTTENVVYIFCWDTRWNRDASSATGLFTDVINTLRVLFGYSEL